eukprot:Gregarina_sp_Pseudo_9__4529@NODE_46_length_5037_cov_13_741297_g43_i0_p2_GENE_NODE_46_length_5037_cov_13_741297_g43_i0NODE_46_length_5037_cov_13_741297_g43_i0_p2_ORF_typecomplete_len513_score121_44PA/PF02225_22/1_8e11PAP_PilO/PF06864_12/2_6e03PAP_PilO/PF06864_12/0_091_NODE_46_length_5037_cov_13_741297_g43_i024884026
MLGILWCCLLLAAAQIRILSPASLQKVFAEGGERETSNGIIVASTATFGTPTYGESFVGRLLLVNTTACEANYADELSQYNITVGEKRVGDAVRDVFLVPRGDCSFVQKVAVAERMGADAVIIMDAPDSNWTRRQIVQVILADDGNGQRVSIPSVLVEKNDGAALAQANFSIPPLINMEWNLPQTFLVRADFWTSSGSAEANRFLAQMAPLIAKMRGFVYFKPHYYILRLQQNLKEDESAIAMCYKGDPDLCAAPPDVGSGPTTAQDVLNENLRQLCLLRLYSEVVPVEDPDYQGEVFYSKIWWDYVSQYYKECPLRVSDQVGAKRFGAECSEQLMRSVGADPAVVQNCVEEQGSTLLQNEKNNNAWGVSSMRVNGMRFSGNLEPSLVLRAVCSAFEREPSECQEAAHLLPGKGASKDRVIVHPTTHPLLHTVIALLVLGTIAMGAMYLYQAHQTRGMRNALRHEVMLEVKSQLQDWYRVEDTSSGVWNELHGAQHTRPLKETEFVKLKFRS